VSINISQSNTALLSNNSNTAQATLASGIGKNGTADSANKADISGVAKDIKISTRAQKLQELSKDFFPAGPQSLKITPQFIQRLQEYGFISTDQAEKFSPQLKSSTAQSGTKTVAQLKGFIETLSTKLEKESPNHSLIDVLKESKSVLESFDKTLTSPKQSNYSNLISKLTQFATSPETDTLNKNDKDALQTLAVTLSIADKLGPAKSTTKGVNQYLSILNR